MNRPEDARRAAGLVTGRSGTEDGAEGTAAEFIIEVRATVIESVGPAGLTSLVLRTGRSPVSAWFTARSSSSKSNSDIIPAYFPCFALLNAFSTIASKACSFKLAPPTKSPLIPSIAK